MDQLIGRWPNERLIRQHTCQSNPAQPCQSCEKENRETADLKVATERLASERKGHIMSPADWATKAED
jgi:hypothetical protein